jgi:hypothetical protein
MNLATVAYYSKTAEAIAARYESVRLIVQSGRAVAALELTATTT